MESHLVFGQMGKKKGTQETHLLIKGPVILYCFWVILSATPQRTMHWQEHLTIFTGGLWHADHLQVFREEEWSIERYPNHCAPIEVCSVQPLSAGNWPQHLLSSRVLFGLTFVMRASQMVISEQPVMARLPWGSHPVGLDAQSKSSHSQTQMDEGQGFWVKVRS